MDAALAPLRLQGNRIINYIDDLLILAQSEQLAVRHRDVVLAHMKDMGLRLNAKKSVLPSVQRTTYLGVVWDSTMMQARLSPAPVRLSPVPSERRPVAHSEAFSKAVGSDGSCVQRGSFWPAAHETLAVVAQDHKVFPEGQPISSLEAAAAFTTGAFILPGCYVISASDVNGDSLE